MIPGRNISYLSSEPVCKPHPLVHGCIVSESMHVCLCSRMRAHVSCTLLEEQNEENEYAQPYCSLATQRLETQHLFKAISPLPRLQAQLKIPKKTLCVIQLHNSHSGEIKKGYGATPSNMCHNPTMKVCICGHMLSQLVTCT